MAKKKNYKIKSKRTGEHLKKYAKVSLTGLTLAVLVANAINRQNEAYKDLKNTEVNTGIFSEYGSGIMLEKEAKIKILEYKIELYESALGINNEKIYNPEEELNNLLNDKEVNNAIKAIFEFSPYYYSKKYVNNFLDEKSSAKDRLIDLYFAMGGDEFDETGKYELNNLFYYNNLDGNQKNLPKQLCVVNKTATCGDYNIYKIVDTTGYNPTCLVTNEVNEIILIGTKDGHINKANEESLVPFDWLLEGNCLDSLICDTYDNSYPNFEFFNNVLYKLNSKICKQESQEENKYFSKDLAILDLTNGCQQQEGNIKDYYFLKLKVAYLFGEGSYVYEDLFNKNAIVIVGKDKSVTYYDLVDYTYIRDEDILLSYRTTPETCFKTYDEFINEYKFPYQASYIKEELETMKDDVSSIKMIFNFK